MRSVDARLQTLARDVRRAPDDLVLARRYRAALTAAGASDPAVACALDKLEGVWASLHCYDYEPGDSWSRFGLEPCRGAQRRAALLPNGPAGATDERWRVRGVLAYASPASRSSPLQTDGWRRTARRATACGS